MRRAAALGLAAAALALVAAAVLVGEAGPARRRGGALARSASAENPDPRGVGAAAAWLAATGRPWQRLASPGEAPPPGGATWLLLTPQAPLGEAEAAAVLARAAAGDLVIWALGEARQPALESALAARRLAGGGERGVEGAPGDPLLGGLALRAAGAGVASDRPGARPALLDPATPGAPPAAVRVPLGRGAVLLLADATPLDNAHVAADDALSLWVRLAARGPVVFDERWLAPALAAPGAAPPGPAAPLAAGQALLAALALLLALAPRLGAVRPPLAPAAGRATAGYLASLAALYRRSGAEPALAADAWRRLRVRLERDAGVPARLGDAAAAEALAARWPAAADAVRHGAAALARGGPGALLAVTRAADDAAAGLRAPRPARRAGL